MSVTYTFILIFACVLGFLGAWIINNYGIKIGIVDVPNDRSSHVGIIPKGGGLGLLAVFMMCSVLLNIAIFFWIPGFCLAVVSFWGDKYEIKPKYRLIIHFFFCLVFLFFYFKSLNSNISQYILVFPLTVFIAGTLNFYNFMDGINGIAGITGLVGFLLLAIYGHASGVNSRYIVLAVSMACSCAGFLPFNIPKAKVFMGDVGSVLLGFVFACLVVMLSKRLLDFICLAGFLFPFYADELITMAVRIKNGDSLGKPHRKHVYQLLANELAIEHWKVSVGYGVLQLFVGVLLIVLRNSGYVPVLSFLFCCFMCFGLFSVIIRMKLKKIHHDACRD